MQNGLNEYDKVNEGASWIHNAFPFQPKTGILLGTGLAGILEQVDIVCEFPFEEIPHLISPQIESHKGIICLGHIHDVPVMIAAGRIHYYEGYELNDVVRIVRLMHSMGCTHLIITNASGGLNRSFKQGDIVAIRDHINLMNTNPLIGRNEDNWGPRFPDMLNAYDPELLLHTQKTANTIGINLQTGVYAGLSGPSLETPAEYEFLHRIGADLVGMSTVPEVIAAKHIGLKVLALSVVSNISYPPEEIKETTIQDVIGAVEKRAEDVGRLITHLIGSVFIGN